MGEIIFVEKMLILYVERERYPFPRLGRVYIWRYFIMGFMLVVFILAWAFSVRRIYLQVGENNWALLAFSTLGVLSLL